MDKLEPIAVRNLLRCASRARAGRKTHGDSTGAKQRASKDAREGGRKESEIPFRAHPRLFTSP